MKNDSENKLFHIGAIITVGTDGIYVSPEWKYLQTLVDYMTGDKSLTHTVPRFITECYPYILDQFPWMKDIDLSDVTHENFRQKVDGWANQYGEWHTVTPIPMDDHDVIDPVEEFINKYGEEKLIIQIIEDNDSEGELE
jgi:hypothetical protein